MLSMRSRRDKNMRRDFPERAGSRSVFPRASAPRHEPERRGDFAPRSSGEREIAGASPRSFIWNAALFVPLAVALALSVSAAPRQVVAQEGNCSVTLSVSPVPAPSRQQQITIGATVTRGIGCGGDKAQVGFFAIPASEPPPVFNPDNQLGQGTCTFSSGRCTVTMQPMLAAGQICEKGAYRSSSIVCIDQPGNRVPVYIHALAFSPDTVVIIGSEGVRASPQAFWITGEATGFARGGSVSTPQDECSGVFAGVCRLLRQVANSIAAAAGTLADFTTSAITKGVLWLSAGAVNMLGSLVNIAVSVLQGTMQLTQFNNVPIVNVGWTITRNLVNLLFILILLVIGFATIFRMETYGIKALLPRLIIVALLVNFSKVIASVIIDAGNLIANFFLTAMGAGSGSSSLGDALANGLNLQRTLQVEWKGTSLMVGNQQIDQLSSMAFQLISGSVFGVIVMFVAAIGIALSALVFVVRIVVLWILVILAPLGWIAGILPATRQYSQMWWQNFLKWVFVAPILLFFFYLLSLFLSWRYTDGQCAGLTPLTCGISQSAQRPLADMATEFFRNGQFLIQYAIIMAFIFAGPIAAASLGAMGAAATIGLARGAQRWALGASGRLAKGGAKGAAGLAGRAALAPVKFGAERAKERLAPLAGRVGAAFARVPGLGALGRLGVKAGEANRAAVGEEMKKFSSLSTPALVAMSQSYSKMPGVSNQNRRLALSTLIAQRRDLADQPEKVRKAAQTEIKEGVNIGRGRRDDAILRPLLAAAPQFAKTGEELEKAVREATRTGAHKNWDKSVFTSSAAIPVRDPVTGASTLRPISGAIIEELYKELGENPQTLKKFGEDLGAQEREAFISGLQQAFTTGSAQKDFNAVNTDLRETYTLLRPENFASAVRDSDGNVNEEFAKRAAKQMKDQTLERFFARTFNEAGQVASPEAQRALRDFESYRGAYKLDEVEGAAQKAGNFSHYRDNLRDRLVAVDDEAERFSDDTLKRSTIFARLSGDAAGAFAANDLTKGLEWQKKAESAVRNFIASLKDEDAEDFGRRADETSRGYVAINALGERLPNFLRGMKQEDRGPVVRMAWEAHRDPTRDKLYRNKLRRDLYVAAIAEDNGVDLGEQEWEFAQGRRGRRGGGPAAPP